MVILAFTHHFPFLRALQLLQVCVSFSTVVVTTLYSPAEINRTHKSKRLDSSLDAYSEDDGDGAWLSSEQSKRINTNT